MTMANYLQARQDRVNAALNHLLPPAEQMPQRLHEAMRYSVFNGGKRLRPLLVYATGEALNVDLKQLDYIACAIECIHAYSLVHDDLPAMDDDDLRRGKPTCHKAFDEATAILAGDALQSLAFQFLVEIPGVTAERKLQMMQVLAVASGSHGMAGGQMLDLQASGQSLDVANLETLHRLKTGALFRASVEMALLAAPQCQPESEQYKTLCRFADCIGLAFQIQDDILDIEADVSILGKDPGSDEKNAKPTYPMLVGLDTAKQKLEKLHQEALAALAKAGPQTDYLHHLTDTMLNRLKLITETES